MKRQRSVSAGEAPAAKKKAKKMTREEAEVAVAVAVGGEGLDYTAVAAMDIVLLEWEEWCSCSSSAWMVGVGDEEQIMCWGTCWCPLWDVELMVNAAAAYEEDLYNDVVWDYDIWDLKLINHIPN